MTTSDIEMVLAKFAYDPETGVFVHIAAAGPRRAGDVAGKHETLGYISLSLGGRAVLAHRVAWLLVTGEWPSHHIDHINGNPADNRACNLRQATHAENLRNTKRRANNQSGVKGVGWFAPKQKWRARIMKDYREIHLGYFDSKTEAAEAYARAASREHGAFARVA